MNTKPEFIICHRGSSGISPENTIFSFQKAFDQGSKSIEFDIRLTKDDKIVIFHDEDLSRITNNSGKVSESTLEYLKKLDVGSWYHKKYSNEKIPTLIEAVEFFDLQNIFLNIEIKTEKGNDVKFAKILYSSLKKYLYRDNLIPWISSSSKEVLLSFKCKCPHIPVGLVKEFISDYEIESMTKDFQFISLDVNYLTKCKVSKIKDRGILVFVYTVNNYRLAKKLYDWGVDSIFSNFPDLLANEKNNIE